MGVVHLLDHLPDTVAETPGTVWSVLARSLGEQGADSRTALAWRWALTGTSPSPITLTAAPGKPPTRHELLTEAHAEAQLARADSDPGGQVMHARFVLQWLPGELPALPLWNGGPDNRHVTDGAAVPRSRAELDDACSWALLAQWNAPRLAEASDAEALSARGQSDGIAQVLNWACGMTPESPLTRMRVPGRPTLYQLSLDAMHAMASLEESRSNGSLAIAGRMEGVIETFAWLAAWEPDPPVDRHGHLTTQQCPERAEPCTCDALPTCARAQCPACRRTPCVHGFSQDQSN